jgi:hypothetical protein
VQDEREALCRTEHLEHDEERQPDRVAEHRFRLRVDGIGVGHDRIGQVDIERVLAARLAGAKHVQTDAADNCRQPTVEILDGRVVGTGEPQPRLLHGIVGLGERAEHPVRDGAQAIALGVESLGQHITLVHPAHLPPSYSYDEARRGNVTGSFRCSVLCNRSPR